MYIYIIHVTDLPNNKLHVEVQRIMLPNDVQMKDVFICVLSAYDSVITFFRKAFVSFKVCMFVTRATIRFCTKIHLMTVPCLIALLHTLVSAFVKTHEEIIFKYI